MIRLYKLSCFLLFLPIFLNAQNYLWPTNASQYLTSSFCEYRPGHYHSAIDIKTWNKEGYPCYAVDDGYIYRLRVSTVGYGKAFYIKLKDGRFAVYGHLQRFSSAIEKLVRQKQIENQKYTLNWYPEKKIYVKKGEIIGYSGQTGIGVPHLHFEIRDSLEHPLNPLYFYKDKIKDNIAPVLQSLMIIPRDENSTVNGSFLPQKVQLVSNGKNQYRLKKPLYVSGKIGLALKGYDRANGVHNAFSFYRTELFANNKRIFRLQYDWMDFENTKEVDLEIYYPERAATKKVYHQLFIEPVTSLQYYDRSLGSGIIQIDQQKVTFKIVVSDYFGNTSTISGELQPRKNSRNNFFILSKVDSSAYFKLLVPDGLKDLKLFAADKTQLWKPINYFEFLNRKNIAQGEEIIIKAVLPSAECYNFKAEYITEMGKAQSFASSLQPENVLMKLQAKSLGKFLVLHFLTDKISHYNFNLYLQSGKNKQITPFEYSEKKYEKVIPARFFNSDSLKIKIASLNKVYLDTVLFYAVFKQNTADTADFKNGVYSIKSFKNSFYDTTLIHIYESNINNFKINMPVLSDLINIEPNYQILKNNVLLTMAYNGICRYPEKLGIYKLKPSKGFSFIGGKTDTLKQFISTKSPTLGRFFVGLDTIAPVIKIILPKWAKTVKPAFIIKFKVKDTLSDIAAEDDISVTIDGKFVLPEWDPETEFVVARPHWQVERGRHKIRISVKDAVGNENIKEINVTVK
jgi:hypothetical protein